MAKRSLGSIVYSVGFASAVAIGAAVAIGVAVAIAFMIQVLSNQAVILLQQLEMQQPQQAAVVSATFNAKEFAERMGRFIGAGLALGLAGVGAGIAVGLAGAAAISAFTEKPEVFGRSFLIVVLGEGIAIYGIAIAILVLILGVP